ncbi:MAG TPA: hypothetical protein VL240_09735 [Candidatus Binatia bacterium]|nr:hypothetical protein [Candidatus Binatia bacterium]
MSVARHFILAGSLAVAITASQGMTGQTRAGTAPAFQPPSAALTATNLPLEHQAATFYTLGPSVRWQLEPLVNFRESEIGFSLQSLMNTLRDSRHEGWVLAAYPDPKTSRPLIGAGFSLDVPAREHVQRDPLNPNAFLEPSSAQLWEAAGLAPQRLQSILEQFDRDLSAWSRKRFRRKIRTHSLAPQITDEDATRLLRISAVQAIHNARAYCRYFDQLTGPQQMALSQLVFQMGVNLEEFTEFRAAINTPAAWSGSLQPVSYGGADGGYWKTVQATLIHSDWARRYSSRAVNVIAMLDPEYGNDPSSAEARVRAQVHPLHRHGRRHSATIHTASSRHRKGAVHGTRKS